MPARKCRYRDRMEPADSIASMDSTSRNSVSAVGADNIEK